ncbi:unknown [Corallococcus sp. CAG:1435]|nr:unknown [Corallococcus sp. CAG:1435]
MHGFFFQGKFVVLQQRFFQFTAPKFCLCQQIPLLRLEKLITAVASLCKTLSFEKVFLCKRQYVSVKKHQHRFSFNLQGIAVVFQQYLLHCTKFLGGVHTLPFKKPDVFFCAEALQCLRSVFKMHKFSALALLAPFCGVVVAVKHNFFVLLPHFFHHNFCIRPKVA